MERLWVRQYYDKIVMNHRNFNPKHQRMKHHCVEVWSVVGDPSFIGIIILHLLQPTSKQQEENKMQKPKPLQTGSAAVDIPKASKAIGKSSFLT